MQKIKANEDVMNAMATYFHTVRDAVGLMRYKNPPLKEIEQMLYNAGTQLSLTIASTQLMACINDEEVDKGRKNENN